jgi:hypothetical protein
MFGGMGVFWAGEWRPHLWFVIYYSLKTFLIFSAKTSGVNGLIT